MKRTFIVSFVALFFNFHCSIAQVAPDRTKHYNILKTKVAIEGYDPVAYFEQKKAMKGKNSISFLNKGITYFFSTEAHKTTFQKSPEVFEPQYGGWCAFAMGNNGNKVEIDPETFKIIDGKLYLFYNKYFNNTLTEWNKDEKRLKKQADSNWQKLIK